MMALDIVNTGSGRLPSDYREVRCWKISEKTGRIVVMNLLSVPLGLVCWVIFVLFVHACGEATQTMFRDADQNLILLVGIVITIALHEYVHGLAMRAFGAQAKYGFMWKGPMFYATSPGYAFQRRQYLVVSLAPLVSLSILAGCGILVLAGTSLVWPLALWATINAASAIGDLWITAIVIRYPSNAYVVDERDGVRIFMPENERTAQ
ncbi:MAG: DUF3267 domain-containing protein [Bacteroidota bacterium]